MIGNDRRERMVRKDMSGVLINTLTVVVGSLLGMFLKKGIPERITDELIKGISLCTMCIGWVGTLKGENTLIMILSMAIGIVIGELLNLDKRLNQFAARIEQRWKKENETVSIAEGFVTASLLFCVGAMTIVGSLQAGLQGDCQMLYTKSLLDLVSSFVLASTLGIGVLFAGAFVFLFQGAIVLFAGCLAPVLSDAVIAEMTCVGSLLIFALGLNLLGITKLKVMNYLPAIFVPIVLVWMM